MTGFGLVLGAHARSKGFQLFMADMKVRVEQMGETYFYYLDLLLSCDPEDRETYYRRNPCLIVEVLSPSAELIDRREKLFAYRSIPGLREYMLVDPDQRRVEVYCYASGGMHEVITKAVFAWIESMRRLRWTISTWMPSEPTESSRSFDWCSINDPRRPLIARARPLLLQRGLS